MIKFKHLEEVKLGYFEHMKGTLRLTGSCLKASGVLLIHSIYPDAFGITGTEILKNALAKLKENQNQNNI